uniref:Uncharacterized protein At2g17340 isoform X2 n=1 Tax=Rhizophora mucronata TaxID=61149 RepID=A0A2P2J7H2_RHIMU
MWLFYFLIVLIVCLCVHVYFQSTVLTIHQDPTKDVTPLCAMDHMYCHVSSARLVALSSWHKNAKGWCTPTITTVSGSDFSCLPLL